MKISPRFLLLVILGLACSCTDETQGPLNHGGATIDQSFPNDIHRKVTVTGERPLLEAAKLVERTYHVPVIYEDPLVINVADAAKMRKISHVTFTLFVPKLTPSPTDQSSRAGLSMLDAIQDYDSQQMADAGAFYLSSIEAKEYVSPALTTNTPSFRKIQPLLNTEFRVIPDHPIADKLVPDFRFKPRHQTAYEVVKGIARRISEIDGIDLEVGSLKPEKAFREYRTTITEIEGGASLIDLLREMQDKYEPLRASGSALSLDLLCEPAEPKCTITTHVVRPKG